MPAVRSRPKLRLKLEEQIDMILPSPAAATAPSRPLCAALTPAPAARKDTRFPKNGSPDDVRKHLNAMQAEGDMFEAVDDAETDWLCC
jgi:hypothetical protein